MFFFVTAINWIFLNWLDYLIDQIHIGIYLCICVRIYQLFTHLIRSPGCWAILLMNDVGSSVCGCKLSSPPRNTCCWHVVKFSIDYDYNNILSPTWSVLGDGLHDHKRTCCLRNFVLFFRLGSVFKCIFWKRKIFVIRWKFITMGLVFLCFCKLQILSLIQIFSIIWSFYFSGFLAHNKYCHLPCFKNCNLVLVVWICCTIFLQLHILQPILSSI